jgi:hypothetical protein
VEVGSPRQHCHVDVIKGQFIIGSGVEENAPFSSRVNEDECLPGGFSSAHGAQAITVEISQCQIGLPISASFPNERTAGTASGGGKNEVRCLATTTLANALDPGYCF